MVCLILVEVLLLNKIIGICLDFFLIFKIEMLILIINNILLIKNINFFFLKSVLYGILVYFRLCEMVGDMCICLC